MPIAAAALTFIVVAVCFTYGIGNLSDDDGGYMSMAELPRAALPYLSDQADLVILVAGCRCCRSCSVWMSVVGGLSLGLGLYAAFAVARGVPVAINGPFETRPAAPGQPTPV